MEVIGFGGIYGNFNLVIDFIWVIGWDYKLVLVGVRSEGDWFFFCLLKVSNSYDGVYGWNIEWL